MVTEQTIPTSAQGPKFIVRKRFIEGPLQDLEIDDRSPVPFVVGETYGGVWGSKYVVVACEEQR